MKKWSLSLVFSLAMTGPLLWAQAAPSHSTNNANSIPAEAKQLMQLANQARAAAGAQPLQWDPALANAALKHCQLMAAAGAISHQFDGEPDPAQRTSQAGARFSLVEENVAVAATPATIHDKWMHSPLHRANLLNHDIDRIGVAVVAGKDGLYAVADYSRAVTSLSQAQVEAKVGGLVHAKGMTLLNDASLARTACTMDQGMPTTKTAPFPRFVMRWQDADLSVLPDALVERMATGKYHQASVGNCPTQGQEGNFTAYRIAVLLF
jgi:hypothetical protein